MATRKKISNLQQSRYYSSKKEIYAQEENTKINANLPKTKMTRIDIRERKNYYPRETLKERSSLSSDSSNNIQTRNKQILLDKKAPANTSYGNTKAIQNSLIKKKKNRKKIIIIIFIIAILLLIPFYIWAIKSQPSNSNEFDNNIENNSSNDNNKDEWDNLSKTLDFYKENFKKRYIAYKEKNPNLDLEKVVVYVNIGLDQEFYSNISDSPNKSTDFVLVNKYYFLGEDYVPLNLETINSKYSSGSKKMESSARIAFEAMAKDARLEGYTIRAVSTYRSYSYQKSLYSNYVKNDGVEAADTYSARAGFSEHQTGLAVDVDNARESYTSFGETKEFEWMLKNAYKYGFILRYTKDNEFITGYKDEPWHYRYVGVKIANYIHNNPMTYEEYYARFLDK